MLQTGKVEEATQLTTGDPDARNLPSWRAEYIATHALALACLGDDEGARAAAALAGTTSQVVEVRVLVTASNSVVSARQGDISTAIQLLDVANNLGAWDPVVCALRSSPELADGLATDETACKQLRLCTHRQTTWGWRVELVFGLARHAAPANY